MDVINDNNNQQNHQSLDKGSNVKSIFLAQSVKRTQQEIQRGVDFSEETNGRNVKLFCLFFVDDILFLFI